MYIPPCVYGLRAVNGGGAALAPFAHLALARACRRDGDRSQLLRQATAAANVASVAMQRAAAAASSSVASGLRQRRRRASASQSRRGDWLRCHPIAQAVPVVRVPRVVSVTVGDGVGDGKTRGARSRRQSDEQSARPRAVAKAMAFAALAMTAAAAAACERRWCGRVYDSSGARLPVRFVRTSRVPLRRRHRARGLCARRACPCAAAIVHAAAFSLPKRYTSRDERCGRRIRRHNARISAAAAVASHDTRRSRQIALALLCSSAAARRCPLDQADRAHARV